MRLVIIKTRKFYSSSRPYTSNLKTHCCLLFILHLVQLFDSDAIITASSRPVKLSSALSNVRTEYLPDRRNLTQNVGGASDVCTRGGVFIFSYFGDANLLGVKCCVPYKMSRPLPTRNTVEKWLREFPEFEFDGIHLYCRRCNAEVSWRFKTHILQHVATQKHKTSVSGSISARERQKQFNIALAKMITGCNIPWAALNNPHFTSFLQSCLSGQYTNVVIPDESTLRKNYLPQVCDEIEQKIVSELKDSNVWVCVDETTDVSGRNIANVLVGGLDESKAMDSHLISSKVLERTNAQTIYECVVSSLRKLWGKNYEQNTNRVLLLLTDAAAYMKAAGQHLRNTYPNLLHVTCLAHGLNRIAEAVREKFPNVDKLISTVKKIFVKAPSRRQLFQEYLPDVPLPPQPVITRWGTWIDAASYYYSNFDSVMSIVQKLDPREALVISQAQQALADPTIKEDLAFIHGHFSKISSAIRNLELSPTSSGYSITNAVNIVYDLRHYISQLSGEAAEHVQTKFDRVLNNNPGFNTICRIVDLFAGQEVDFSRANVNIPSVRNYQYFKYAPVTSVDVERSFSVYKWILSERRRKLTPEHLEQLLIISCNSSAI